MLFPMKRETKENSLVNSTPISNRVLFQPNYQLNSVRGDERNLRVFDMVGMGNISPFKNINYPASCQKKVEVARPAFQELFTPDSSKFSNSNLGEERMSKFMCELKRDAPKFSPAQSKQSGFRMFNQYQIQQHRLQKKVQEREQELMLSVREKPKICKKSAELSSMNDLKSSQDMRSEFQSAIKRHHHCYFKEKKTEDELTNCTHSPKINDRSRKIASRKTSLKQNLAYPAWGEKRRNTQEEAIRLQMNQVLEQKTSNKENVRCMTPGNYKKKSVKTAKTKSQGNKSLGNKSQGNLRSAEESRVDKRSQGEEMLLKLCHQYEIPST